MSPIPQTTLNELREGFKLIREGLLAISHASGALEAHMVNMIEAQYEAGDHHLTQAQDLQAKQTEHQDPKPTEHTPEPVEADPEPTEDGTGTTKPEATNPSVSFVQLRTKLSELAKAGHRLEVKQLLTGAGYGKLSDVPEQAYQTLFDAADEITEKQAA